MTSVARVFVTGATGLAGSHVVERLRGGPGACEVVALVRSPGAAAFLAGPGVKLVQGDVTAPERLQAAMAGCDALIHCAATVGDGASRRELMRVNAQGTTRILQTARAAGVPRAIVLSSLAVLGTKAHRGTDETAPYGHTGDPYLESKIAGEQAARRFAEDQGYPVTILRPTQIYGPRDRAFLPVVIENLRQRKMVYVDRGERLMSVTHAANVAEAVALALARPAVAGEIFHITDGVLVSRREFVEAICQELGIEPPRITVSYPVLQLACNAFELAAHISRSRKPPLLNRYRFKFLACHLDYSIEKARRELGYVPVITPGVGIPESVRWLQAHRPDLFEKQPRALSPLARLLGDPELARRNQALMTSAKP